MWRRLERPDDDAATTSAFALVVAQSVLLMGILCVARWEPTRTKTHATGMTSTWQRVEVFLRMGARYCEFAGGSKRQEEDPDLDESIGGP